jgi:hypothetical protein
MQPGDLLFVRHHDIHRPVISPERVYERIVLWILAGVPRAVLSAGRCRSTAAST